MRPTPAAGVLLAALGVATACGGPRNPHVLTFAGSAVGAEAAAIRRQLDRFHAAHPSMRVELRATPDAADQRHQLYVQWLNAHAADPDVLQLDVVWTPEFAAAGWIASLDGFQPAAGDFFPQAIAASRWRGVLYALPWFLDAGTLYWRTDLMRTPPADFDALDRIAARAQREHGLPFGFVWEGALRRPGHGVPRISRRVRRDDDRRERSACSARCRADLSGPRARARGRPEGLHYMECPTTRRGHVYR